MNLRSVTHTPNVVFVIGSKLLLGKGRPIAALSLKLAGAPFGVNLYFPKFMVM
jgi:hypothetical protein